VSGPVSTLLATLQTRRFWQFAAVGIVGTTVDFSILIGLTEFLDVHPVLAKVVGAETAILVMFAINETWTFATWGAGTSRAILRRLVTSNLVRTGGIAVATGVLAALYTWYDVWYVYANGIGIACGFVVNYTLENLLTWRTHR